jgi:IS30 family transposase
MGRGKHLTKEERDKISILHAESKSKADIARILGRHRSVITKELKKETSVFYRGKYLGSQSHGNVERKWKKSHKQIRMNSQVIQEYVIEKLKLYWSPEIISERIKIDLNLSVSHETIYMWVYKERNDLTVYLTKKQPGRKPRTKHRKSKRNLIPNRIDIDQRPVEADKREEFGHFEADCIESSRNSKTALLVISDRTSRRTKIKKLTRKTAEQASSQIIFALKDYNIIDLKTMTYDNGCEFCWHERVNEELNTKSFFCKPYHAWEKGTVENINGIIRRFFPKKTDFDSISLEQIQYVEDWINNRPMKVLNFKTPNEKYRELITKYTSVSIAS